MLKRMVYKLIMWATREQPAPQATYAPDVLHGTELAMTAYKIENGYLLRLGGSLIQTPIIYCTDEKDMAEKIVAYRAKLKFGVGGAKAHVNVTTSI